MTTTETAMLTQLSARELAERIARGEVSAVEAVEAYIARIEAVNPALNAVVVKRYDAARAEARAADERRAAGEPLGPLHGVPITIKEAFDLEGTPSTYGLPSRAAALATSDDQYVRRLRQAGAIILGKTNVPQLLLYNETDNPLYGRTNNPWDVTRTPGGSSGGQAALIAAGASPFGLGSDIGGSIRVPAAYCAIAGLKPTAGRLPDTAEFGVSPGQTAIVSQAGPLGRGVDDVALALDILNGGRTPDAEPPRPLADHTAVDIAGLRVAYYSDDGILPPAPAVRRAVVEAAGMLAGRGAQVTEWQPPTPRAALDLWLGILAADGAATARQMLKGNARDPRIGRLVFLAARSRPTLAFLRALLTVLGQRNAAAVLRDFGRRDTAHYWALVEAQRAYQRQFARALDADDGGPFDVIICPASPTPAFPHGLGGDLLTSGAYAVLYNVLGYPAGVVPVTRVRPGEDTPRRRSLDTMDRAARKADQGSAGLPVGVQVVARPWRDHVALAAMRAIEASARLQPDYPHAPLPL
ncbi:MAG TPA: amidase [Ktedonobacterales bacterium]|nr:amidase [Ktedonobacterales bacterium]